MLKPTRRQVLGYGALAAPMLALKSSPAAYIAREKVAPTGVSLLGARIEIFTIVTPDLDASLRFYHDIMGFPVIAKGKLGSRLPTVAGVGNAGRAYAIVKTTETGERGTLRLLEAPKGAAANRPRPGSSIIDPGFATIECLSRAVDESYHLLTSKGVKTISGPRYYYFNGMTPLPGAEPEKDFEFRSYSAFGPAGEQVFISSGVSSDHKPWPAWTHAGLHEGFTAGVLVSLDRWPVWDFYNAVFGLKPTRDTYTGAEAVNELIGAPEGYNCQFGFLGGDMEWWEYRDRPPTATPPFPTDLDKTGLAMATMVVNDLAEIRARAKDAGYQTLGEGALPTPDVPYQDGFYLRGGVGELVEVIGRPA
jgi:catechol 2,3-dioxygenase-like lactoylglutathione lyase family enzyme